MSMRLLFLLANILGSTAFGNQRETAYEEFLHYFSAEETIEGDAEPNRARYLIPTQPCLRSTLMINSCFTEDSFTSSTFDRLEARAFFSTGLASFTRDRVTHGMLFYIDSSIDIAVMRRAALTAGPYAVCKCESIILGTAMTAQLRTWEKCPNK